MISKNIYKIAALSALSLVPLHCFADGINCQNARSVVETLICSDPALVQQDLDLAKTYTDKLAATSDKDDKNEIMSDQKQWLADRNLCTNKACVESSYQQRMQVLKPSFYGFEFNGKPINPQCVAQFSPWESDAVDSPFMGSILLDGCTKDNVSADGNDAKIDNRGFLSFDHKRESSDDSYAGFYAYRVLGKTNNNIYVVHSQDNGGGSLTSDDLLFFKINQRPVFPVGIQTVLELVGVHSLTGGLCPGTVKISGNKVNFSELSAANSSQDLIKACNEAPDEKSFDLTKY